MRNRILWLIALSTVALIVGLVTSVGVISADDTLTDTEVGSQTIDLLGLTWDKDEVTWRLDTGGNVTVEAEAAMLAAIDRWTHHLVAFGFTLIEVVGNEAPDIILKWKKGGGRIAGQARWKQRDGFFQQVTISVSGSAFGTASGAPLVESITMQEIGHGPGLGHSDNSNDVMFGTVQDTPNIQLSDCDIEAWKVVMAWLPALGGTGTAVPPTDPSFSCGTNGGGNGGGTTAGPLTVSVDIVDEPAGGYNGGDKVHLDVKVIDANGDDVAGVAVHVIVDKAGSGFAQGDGTTGSDGKAHFSLRLHKKHAVSGHYEVDASAAKDDVIGSCTHCAHFEVN